MNLSIIVPVYNAEKTIRRCLDSVCPQMRQGYELLLIDDGSTDGSLKILNEYRMHVSESIRVLHHDNHGAAYTRNRGIEEARGEYLCFIDQDDHVDDRYFESYLKAAEIEKPDLILGGYRRVTEEKELFCVHADSSPWYPYTVTAPWARLYRTAFLKKHPEIRFLEYPMGEDVFFNLGCYQSEAVMRCIPYTGYNWVDNKESVSNTVQRGFDRRIRFPDLLEKLYSVCDPGREYTELFFSRYCIWYLLFSGRKAEKMQFVQEYRQITEWLSGHDFSLRFPVLRRDLRCERNAVKVSMAFLCLLHRMHMMPAFALLYCRGNAGK